ncbi:MAG: hypothetical protein M4579_004425 [Chaenotheca gracillima]|nr:MAG: hypothetical protein M4579_004425 [Chaenotheca gracillima]
MAMPVQIHQGQPPPGLQMPPPPPHHGMPPPPPHHHGPPNMPHGMPQPMPGLQQSMHAMNLGGQAPRPQHKMQEVIDLTQKSKKDGAKSGDRPVELEGYTLRRESKKGTRLNWLTALRTEMMLPHEELQRLVKSQEDKRRTGKGASVFKTYKELGPKELRQVDQLLQDKNKAAMDPNAEWNLAYLHQEKKKRGWSEPAITTAITVILKKEIQNPQKPAGAQGGGQTAWSGGGGGGPAKSFPQPNMPQHPQMAPGPGGHGGPGGPGGHMMGPPPMGMPMHMQPQQRPPPGGPQGHPGPGNQAPVIVVGGNQQQNRPPQQYPSSMPLPPPPHLPPGVINVPNVNTNRARPPPGGSRPSHHNGGPGYLPEPKKKNGPQYIVPPSRGAQDRVRGWVSDQEEEDDDDVFTDSEDDSVDTPNSLESAGDLLHRRRAERGHIKPGQQLHNDASRPNRPAYRDHRRASPSPAPRARHSLEDLEEVSLRDRWIKRASPIRGGSIHSPFARPTIPHRGFTDDRLVSARHGAPHPLDRYNPGMGWPDQAHEDAVLHEELQMLRQRDHEARIKEQMLHDRNRELARQEFMHRARADPYFGRPPPY